MFKPFLAIFHYGGVGLNTKRTPEMIPRVLLIIALFSHHEANPDGL